MIESTLWKRAGPSPRTIAIIAVWCLLAARLAFLSIIVPPWQNPDEPAHFAVIRAFTRQAALDLTKRRDPVAEAEILDSMAEHGWWEAYGTRPPTPVPRTFEQEQSHLGQAYSLPVLYYLAASRLCRALDVRSLLGQYYLLRAASALITLLTLVVIMRAARQSFGEDAALCAAALVALVPRFALIGIAVSPDPLVFLAAAFVWWQAARLAAGIGIVRPIVMMAVATTIAVLSKQAAFVLILQTPLLVFLALVTRISSRRARVMTVLAVSTLVIAALAAGAAILAQPNAADRLGHLVEWIHSGGQPLSIDYFFQFSWETFTTAYLTGGWLRFYPPVALPAVALAVCAFGGVRGVAISLAPSNRSIRVGAIITLMFLLVQFWAIYGTRFYLPWHGADGRYLYAAIGPLATFCAFGLVRWKSSVTRTAVCCSAVSVMAVLEVVGWVTTVIPPYAR